MKALNKENLTNQQAGFSTPANYFESFEGRVQSQIEFSSKNKSQRLLVYLKPWLALAGMFVFVGLLYQFLRPQEVVLLGASESSFEVYYSEFYINQSDEELMNYVAEEGIELESSLTTNNYEDLTIDEIDELTNF